MFVYDISFGFQILIDNRLVKWKCQHCFCYMCIKDWYLVCRLLIPTVSCGCLSPNDLVLAARVACNIA